MDTETRILETLETNYEEESRIRRDLIEKPEACRSLLLMKQEPAQERQRNRGEEEFVCFAWKEDNKNWGLFL